MGCVCGGNATRNRRSELLRLLAIPHIRTEQTWKLDALKRELERLGETELERLVIANPLSAAAANALGINPANLPSTTRNQAGDVTWGAARNSSNTIEPFPGPADAVELWHHVELLLGLKWLVSSKANSAVRSVAKKICEGYLG